MADWRAGQETAFDALFARYQRPLRAYSGRMLGDAALADEVCIEVFVRLLQTRHPPDRLRPCLFTVARRLCIDRLRRAERWRRISQWLPVASPPADPEVVAALDERSRQVQKALSRLTERHRSAVLLVHGQGMSAAEAGEVLELRNDQVRSLVSYALKVLRAEVGDD